MERVSICFAIFLIMGCFAGAYAADPIYDVDYYIEQSAKQYKDLQKTVEEAFRFTSEFRQNTQNERLTLDLLDALYDAIAELRDALYSESKMIFLYKYVDIKHKEVASGFMLEELGIKFEFLDKKVRRPKSFLDIYKKGEPNNAVMQLVNLMTGQIESSGRLLVEMKDFYALENKKAKSKG